ncbi:viral protein 22 [Macropodid alphaherpesvirus 2]|uniref:Tegument protein VP22 n=1 Tax=Macropodid alphaherpesvirus 2 TaxID=83440 RepID=A0AAE7SXX7_9ALPH|nr:viral protein 22 [Macropodid alphaherpesvirus 2]QOD40241.1 viral protein 22 [Macropodid alphaherpesvirus 2]WGO49716.1 viral protein 22 [Macropodid alphaherpesvirus 2]
MYNQRARPTNRLQPHKHDPLQTQLGFIRTHQHYDCAPNRRPERTNNIAAPGAPSSSSSERPLVLTFTKKNHSPNTPQKPPPHSSEGCEPWEDPNEAELCARAHMIRLESPQPGRVKRVDVPPAASIKPTSLQFSETPHSPTALWTDAIKTYNKRVFCAAVGRVAAKHARCAASHLWDMVGPRTDDHLNDLLGATNIRITVCEGYNLLLRANEPVCESVRCPPHPSTPPQRTLQCPLKSSKLPVLQPIGEV